MVNEPSKKELQTQYKEREVIGGVYAIRNTLNNRLYLDATLDLRGSKNRFEFAKDTGSCVYPKLQDDWTKQDGRHFEFQVLEELKREPTQSDAEFKADIELIKQICLERLANEAFY